MKKVKIDYLDGRYLLDRQHGLPAEIPHWLWWLYRLHAWVERVILYPCLNEADQNAWEAKVRDSDYED